jgi:acetyltransferase-like isoleucine patch superfamily enzyme
LRPARRVTNFINPGAHPMSLFQKLIRTVHRLSCALWNRQYYAYAGIDRSVVFAASYPGLVKILAPENIRIGPGTVINAEAIIHCAGGVAIGRYVHIGHALSVYSTNHNYQNAQRIPYDEHDLIEPVEIGDFVWIGANVSIMPGVSVGEGAVLGGGSVVTKDVPKYAVMGGNPARVLKYRDATHFDDLKKQEKFQ